MSRPRVRGFESHQRRNVGKYAELLRSDSKIGDRTDIVPTQYRVTYSSIQLGEVEKYVDYWSEVKRIIRRVQSNVVVEGFDLEEGWFKVTPALANVLDLRDKSEGEMYV